MSHARAVESVAWRPMSGETGTLSNISRHLARRSSGMCHTRVALRFETMSSHSNKPYFQDTAPTRVCKPRPCTYGFATTSVDTILVATSNKGVIAVLIHEHADQDILLDALRAQRPRSSLRLDPSSTKRWLARIASFIEHPGPSFELPLDIRGTEFSRIANTIESPRAARAVGNVCSQNPLKFAIPCHRILRSDVSYSGGSAWGDVRQPGEVTGHRSPIMSSLNRIT